MLNIYYGNETVDKEKFIFNKIANNQGKTLLIVPDQFSAQTESNAFFYLGKKATMDLRVFHFERLGQKVLQESGIKVPPLIDKYGRHMLLTRIMRKEEGKNNLQTYKGMSGKSSFIEMMNGLISEIKRNGVGPKQLRNAIEMLEDNMYLKRKLQDIVYIFEEYEDAIENKYLDSEDYITFYGDAMINAPMIFESTIWIYGFDTFTSRNLQVISRLITAAKEVNIVMNYENPQGDRSEGNETDSCLLEHDAAFFVNDSREEIFELTGHVIDTLKNLGNEIGTPINVIQIEELVRHSIWNETDSLNDKITLVATSNVHAEVERAAAYILSLVRDCGYRYGDINVICNDTTGTGATLCRVLQRWNIPTFMDTKRTVLHHPVIGFVLALLDCATDGLYGDSAMRLVKSNLMDFRYMDAELLENYVLTYKIRGNKWHHPFDKHGKNISEDELKKLNTLRSVITKTVDGVKDSMGRHNNAGEKIRGLYEYLTGTFKIEDRLNRIMDIQEDMGLLDAASETAQSWNTICAIFNQIVAVMGEEPISNKELKKLLIDGLSEVEIGIVPAHSDSVLIGTMQRTRLSRNKVLVVVGTNEGVLPLGSNEEGILSESELETLESMNLNVAKSDYVARGEEVLAMYRNFSAPSERLYMSYSAMTPEGDDMRPSRVYNMLRAYMTENFDGYATYGDLESESEIMTMVTTPVGTLDHVAKVVSDYMEGIDIDDDWRYIINWFNECDDEAFNKMCQGRSFTNRLEHLEQNLSESLYMGGKDQIEMSVSRLEKYSGCPFSHFLNYGLRPEEIVEYEMGAREIGDVYHECLMRFSQRLEPDDGIAINAPESPWMSIDEKTCANMIREILTNEMTEYGEGLLSAGEQERYRTERIVSVCSKVAMSMVHQVQKGHLISMEFEKHFEEGAELPPIRVKVGNMQIMLRGIIDRMDILDAGHNQEAVRIIDYKTGNNEIKKSYFESGYKLQLMVYLNAAIEGGEREEHSLAPAGVFHFYINEMDDDDGDGKASGADTAKRQDKYYRLKGIVLNEANVIRAMDSEFEDTSDVIPIKMDKKQRYAATSTGEAAKDMLLSREEFNKLCETVNAQVERICTEILDGDIDIAPRKADKSSACKFCKYKSICLFDTSFKECKFIKVD